MIFGRLIGGRLTDIASRDAIYAEDVPLTGIPAGFGPFAYDAVNQVATPLDQATLTPDERALRRGVSLALAALLVRASSTATVAQKAKAQAVIDNAAAQVLDLLA